MLLPLRDHHHHHHSCPSQCRRQVRLRTEGNHDALQMNVQAADFSLRSHWVSLIEHSLFTTFSWTFYPDTFLHPFYYLYHSLNLFLSPSNLHFLLCISFIEDLAAINETRTYGFDFGLCVSFWTEMPSFVKFSLAYCTHFVVIIWWVPLISTFQCGESTIRKPDDLILMSLIRSDSLSSVLMCWPQFISLFALTHFIHRLCRVFHFIFLYGSVSQ